MSIKNITDKILSDAKAKEKEILESSNSEAKKLVESKITEAKALEKQIMSKAKEEALSTQNRIVQSAELKVRNEKLSAKHGVIEKSFDLALKKLEGFNESEYINFIKNTLKAYSFKGSGTLRVNEYRYSLITSKVLQDINYFLGCNLTLGKMLESGKDGFIIEQEGTLINCTFEALVNSLKEDLIFDVTKILFQ